MLSAVRHNVIVSCLVVLPLLISCSDDGSSDGNGDPQGNKIGASCGQNSDCQSNYCLKDDSFPGSYCSKDCTTDPTCPQGSQCHDYMGYSFCMASCAADGDCRDGGYVCDYGVCRPSCSSNKSCQGTDQCFNGHCKDGCSGPEDCEQGMRCQDGKCLPPCQQDDDCLPGYACDPTSGNCLAKPGKKIGEACTNNGECSTDYCLPTRKICSAVCGSTAKCPSDYVCGLEKVDQDKNGVFESVEAVCVPVKGQGAAGATCGEDADCASEHCYNGFCMEACLSDGDCNAMQCVRVNIMLPAAIPQYQGCLPRKSTSSFTLGTFPGDSLDYRGFDIPSNAASFVLNSSVNSSTEAAIVLQLTDPDGKVLTVSTQVADTCDFYAQPNRYYPREQVSSLFVPNTPAVKLIPGIYTYVVGATDPSQEVTVTLDLKLGRADKGTLNLNWFFLNLAGSGIPGATLNAASAPTHTWLGKVRNNMRTILQQAGLSVGAETYHDVNDPALDIISLDGTGTPNEIKKLYGYTQGIQGKAINLFLVREITESTMGGMVLGYSGSIPGPPARHGTIHSGVIMSAMTEQLNLNPAHTMAHEICHHLGLFHNQEAWGSPGLNENHEVVCPCPCSGYMSCKNSWNGQYCQGEDPIPDTTAVEENLMWWAAESTEMFEGNQLTPGQIRVLLDNPLVGH